MLIKFQMGQTGWHKDAWNRVKYQTTGILLGWRNGLKIKKWNLTKTHADFFYLGKQSSSSWTTAMCSTRGWPWKPPGYYNWSRMWQDAQCWVLLDSPIHISVEWTALTPSFLPGAIPVGNYLTFKALHGTGPDYLQNYLFLRISGHSTRSHRVGTLQGPSFKYCHLVGPKKYAFSVVAPYWTPFAWDPAALLSLNFPKSCEEVALPPVTGTEWLRAGWYCCWFLLVLLQSDSFLNLFLYDIWFYIIMCGSKIVEPYKS